MLCGAKIPKDFWMHEPLLTVGTLHWRFPASQQSNTQVVSHTSGFTSRAIRHEWHEVSCYAASYKRLRTLGRGSARYRCALGRRLLARGSTRPNRSPTSCCAIARSIACSKNSRSAGAAGRIASWNAVIVCSVTLKLSCRGRFWCVSAAWAISFFVHPIGTWRLGPSDEVVFHP
jgi:hypothetical protein